MCSAEAFKWLRTFVRQSSSLMCDMHCSRSISVANVHSLQRGHAQGYQQGSVMVERRLRGAMLTCLSPMADTSWVSDPPRRLTVNNLLRGTAMAGVTCRSPHSLGVLRCGCTLDRTLRTATATRLPISFRQVTQSQRAYVTPAPSSRLQAAARHHFDFYTGLQGVV